MRAGTRSGLALCISQHLALGAVDKYLSESMNKMKTEAKIIAWKKKIVQPNRQTWDGGNRQEKRMGWEWRLRLERRVDPQVHSELGFCWPGSSHCHVHTHHLGILLRCRQGFKQVWAGSEDLHFSDCWPKLQGPHCQGQSHTLRIPHTCIRAGPESKDLAVGSKEGMRTKLTRDLREVQLQKSQKHSLAAGSKDTGGMKALQKIHPGQKGVLGYFRS